MAGCRPFTRDEVKQIRDALLQGTNGRRDAALHVLGCHTGFRVAELLSICRGDVLTAGGALKAEVAVRGKRGTVRSVQIHPTAAGPLFDWLIVQQGAGHVGPCQRVFPLTSRRALQILRGGAVAAGLRDGERRIGTHSWRKTYAQGIYVACLRRLAGGELVDPIGVTMEALGHSDTKTTVLYLGDALKTMAVPISEIRVMS